MSSEEKLFPNPWNTNMVVIDYTTTNMSNKRTSGD